MLTGYSESAKPEMRSVNILVSIVASLSMRNVLPMPVRRDRRIHALHSSQEP
jgi:hypothetical protein